MPRASRKRAVSPYDADNRVDIDGGDLVSGQIQVVARTGSVEHEYNQAGEVMTELSNGGVGYGIQTQTFSYDARGNQVGSVLTGGQVESKQYDADGRLTADVYTYAPGTTVTVTNADGTFHMGIGGWLSMATTYYYNADGAVYATFDYGRPNVNWNLIWNKIDQGTLDPSTESHVPAPSEMPTLSEAANGAGYGVLGLQLHVSHWDPSTRTGGYDKADNALVYTCRCHTAVHVDVLRSAQPSWSRRETEDTVWPKFCLTISDATLRG